MVVNFHSRFHSPSIYYSISRDLLFLKNKNFSKSILRNWKRSADIHDSSSYIRALLPRQWLCWFHHFSGSKDKELFLLCVIWISIAALPSIWTIHEWQETGNNGLFKGLHKFIFHKLPPSVSCDHEHYWSEYMAWHYCFRQARHLGFSFVRRWTLLAGQMAQQAFTDCVVKRGVHISNYRVW